MGKSVLIALFPAYKDVFARGGEEVQVPVDVGINMGGKWQKAYILLKRIIWLINGGKTALKYL